MGSVGNDYFGQKLKESLQKEGMVDCFHIHKTLPTGVCAVLLTPRNRCLLPNLGAACAYPDSHTTSNWVFFNFH